MWLVSDGNIDFVRRRAARDKAVTPRRVASPVINEPSQPAESSEKLRDPLEIATIRRVTSVASLAR